MLPVQERVATGEIPIGLTFVKYACTAARGGAAVVRIDPMLGDSHFAVLSNKAPRPNAGKAFIDLYLDDESMKNSSGAASSPSARAFIRRCRARRKSNIWMKVLDAAAFAEKKKEFGKIFLG